MKWPPGERTLVFAVDDTGHEEFKDPKYQVFGIGGCAFLVRDYQRLIEEPWNNMCKRFFPEIIRPMHAAELRSLTPEQLDAIRHFFENHEFFRVAALITASTEMKIDAGVIQLVGEMLLTRIYDVGKWAEFDRVVIVLEESDRIEMEVIRSLSGKALKREESEMPIELGLAPKSANIPALEVADFIIHTAGAQTRNRIAGKKEVRKDFEIVFRNVDQRLVSFAEITRAAKAKNA